MRLWHQNLIRHLPDKQLLGQHRECCALRGKGWGRKHSVVDYVFKHGFDRLYQYHVLVLSEMVRRGFEPDPVWYNRLYRGKNCKELTLSEAGVYVHIANSPDMIYWEHDDEYLVECLLNLKTKGAKLVNGVTIDRILLQMDLKGVRYKIVERSIMPHKVGKKWKWGNIERDSKQELVKTVYGIWVKNGKKGSFSSFWKTGKTGKGTK